MAPISVGIDLGHSHLRIGGLIIGKYIVAEGSKDIKVNGQQAPSREEVVESFQDARNVVKSFFGAPDFQAAVVVVPNSTSSDNREAVASAARGAGFNIVQVINENTAVAAAYAEKVKPTQSKRLAIVSITGGVLDVSIISVNPQDLAEGNYEYALEVQETHLAPSDFEEQDTHESKRSGPGGLFGLVGGVVGGAVKTLVVDPLDKLLDIVKSVLSSPKLRKSPVDEVVFVGKASKSEKLKQAVKENFPKGRVWSEIEPEEVAAYGGGVLAYKQNSVKQSPVIVENDEIDGGSKLPEDVGALDVGGEQEDHDVGEEQVVEEDDEVENESSKKSVPIWSVIN